jgi:hypothetical protein
MMLEAVPARTKDRTLSVEPPNTPVNTLNADPSLAKERTLIEDPAHSSLWEIDSLWTDPTCNTPFTLKSWPHRMKALTLMVEPALDVPYVDS